MTRQGVQKVGKDVRARLAANEAVDPDSFCFRTAPLFETSDPRYQALTGLQSASYGTRNRDGLTYRVF
jgi:hypothetical protein